MESTGKSALAWTSHFKGLCQSFIYVTGKAPSGKLSCMGVGLVRMEKIANSVVPGQILQNVASDQDLQFTFKNFFAKYNSPETPKLEMDSTK